jgi:hypothetical protein
VSVADSTNRDNSLAAALRILNAPAEARNATSIFRPRPAAASRPLGGRRAMIPDRSRSTMLLPAASTAPVLRV